METLATKSLRVSLSACRRVMSCATSKRLFSAKTTVCTCSLIWPCLPARNFDFIVILTQTEIARINRGSRTRLVSGWPRSVWRLSPAAMFGRHHSHHSSSSCWLTTTASRSVGGGLAGEIDQFQRVVDAGLRLLVFLVEMIVEVAPDAA